ncbi:carbon starvation protein A [candidate division KSB1 bacterium]|nr:carbon starvation protein A [candidate division KSB1 bacterium]
MPASILIVASILIFLIGYIWYGRFLVRKFDIDPSRQTPAHSKEDGVDYVPAKPPVLLGHHFASIAGAGPILGPIYAAVFGWVPVFLWIVIGSLFFGGVHDFASIVASIRHGGKSVGEVIEEYIGKNGKQVFLIFTWFMLILVVAVFARAVGSTFVKEPAAATSSFLFILLALLFGQAVYRLRTPLGLASAIGFVGLLGSVALGVRFPLMLSYEMWLGILFVYVFASSVTPVWALLQPRDYLNAFLLYMVMIGGVVGIFVKNPIIHFPKMTGFQTDLGTLFPVLFVTVACGAISGFHSLVGSGTTSKQLNKETDAKLIGLGGMLIEGVLAVMALITAITLVQSDYRIAVTTEGGGPIGVFASGVGSFIAVLGIPEKIGVTFAALAISAFALTSLDTATRLGRFVFQEYTEPYLKSTKLQWISNRYVGTLITVVAAGVLTFSGTGTALWPLFGSANQLLAALVLLAITVWLAKLKKKRGFVFYPMLFMFAVTLTALVLLVIQNISKGNYLLAGFGLVLFGVAVSLVIEAVRSLRRG